MNFFLNLQMREKMFVLGSVVAVLLTLLFTLVIDPTLTHSARLEKQIRKAQRDLKDLRTQQKEYRQQQEVLGRISQRLSRQQDLAIFAFLAKLADDTGIRKKLKYMKPTVSTPSDLYTEESVEIKIEGVTLEQLIRYLHQVESAPQLLKIKRLSINPRRDKRHLLTAIFRVSVFTPKESTS